ncbi:DUF1833 domain-containing protein [Escherichia coli]|uniref:DUF1833 family protein n=1 Tax=Escherichia coli TaxID=562 RepID=UPI00076F24F8|nr:DUF1833 family protein [Escherichia coli]EBY2984671.1 DUF1833 domain-containing protein [Salmonella enterica subsp. enterica serovar Durban]ECO6189166.1 DUF1833 domain-containing protein [Salmonella enterica]EFC1567474.1 DUF1833 domain-containing protein [Escherichia coli]EFH5841477.1 DUF1833 domain-containing protein [Escherichia coli]EFL9559065.1 DUF1833 domain-containing protein [Escherichia coli]
MTILNRLYASSGQEVIIETLQINMGEQQYFLCTGYDDITAITESGDRVTFVACAMDIALPKRNADGTQDLQFAISNIDGVVSTAVRNALDDISSASIIYRHYLSSDLSAPASPPYTLSIKSGHWTAMQVQITAGYLNVLDLAWPRYRYTLNNFPALRYMR